MENKRMCFDLNKEPVYDVESGSEDDGGNKSTQDPLPRVQNNTTINVATSNININPIFQTTRRGRRTPNDFCKLMNGAPTNSCYNGPLRFAMDPFLNNAAHTSLPGHQYCSIPELARPPCRPPASLNMGGRPLGRIVPQQFSMDIWSRHCVDCGATAFHMWHANPGCRKHFMVNDQPLCRSCALKYLGQNLNGRAGKLTGVGKQIHLTEAIATAGMERTKIPMQMKGSARKLLVTKRAVSEENGGLQKKRSRKVSDRGDHELSSIEDAKRKLKKMAREVSRIPVRFKQRNNDIKPRELVEVPIQKKPTFFAEMKYKSHEEITQVSRQMKVTAGEDIEAPDVIILEEGEINIEDREKLKSAVLEITPVSKQMKVTAGENIEAPDVLILEEGEINEEHMRS